MGKWQVGRRVHGGAEIHHLGRGEPGPKVRRPSVPDEGMCVVGCFGSNPGEKPRVVGSKGSGAAIDGGLGLRGDMGVSLVWELVMLLVVVELESLL